MEQYLGDKIAPDTIRWHDADAYYFRIHLPGVRKEDIELEAVKKGFCLKARKGEKEYATCYSLAYEIDFERIEAKFEEELLDVRFPLKKSIELSKVDIK
jgi:HSP20 family molecular chaperone IbpA